MLDLLPPELLTLVIKNLPDESLPVLAQVSTLTLSQSAFQAEERLKSSGIQTKTPLLSLDRLVKYRQWIEAGKSAPLTHIFTFCANSPERLAQWRAFQGCLEVTLQNRETQFTRVLIQEFSNKIGGQDLILYLLGYYGQIHLYEELSDQFILPRVMIDTDELVDPYCGSSVVLDQRFLKYFYKGIMDGGNVVSLRWCLDVLIPLRFSPLTQKDLNSLLVEMTKNGFQESVEELLKRGADNLYKCLKVAIKNGHKTIVLRLLTSNETKFRWYLFASYVLVDKYRQGEVLLVLLDCFPPSDFGLQFPPSMCDSLASLIPVDDPLRKRIPSVGILRRILNGFSVVLDLMGG